MGKGRPIYNTHDFELMKLQHEFEILRVEFDARERELEAARREARETSGRYTELYEFSPVPILTLDPRGRILECNLAAAELLDYSRAGLIGRDFDGFIRPGFRSSFKEFLKSIHSSYAKHQLELECYTKKNSSIYVQAVGLSMRGEQGYEKRCRVALTDISQQKRKQEEIKKLNKELMQINKGLKLEILQRKNIEVSLQMERKKLETILTNSPVGIAVTDVEGYTILANRVFEEIWGKNRPPAKTLMNYKQYKAWWVDSGREVLPEEWASALVVGIGKPVFDQVMRIRCFDGTKKVINNSAAPIFDVNGKVAGSVVAVVDITERKRLEEELKKANEELEERVRKRAFDVVRERQRLFSVLESLPVYVVLLTEDYRVPFANKYFIDRFGDSQSRRCYEYLFNRDKSCEDCETYKVLETKQPQNREWTGPDGRIYDIYDYPFPEADGTTMILEMGIDITKRKQAEAELIKHREHLEELVRERSADLRESAARLQITQEIAHLGSWELDLTQNRLTWSAETYRIFGVDPHEFTVTYEAFLELVHPNDRVFLDKVFKESVQNSREGYEIEHRLIRKSDGVLRIVHEKCIHIRDDAGSVVRSLGMVHDITQRKAAEDILARDKKTLETMVEERTKELLDARLELEKARRLSDIGTLAATVAHELRNPLATINMAAYNIGKKAQNPLLEKYLENIRKKVQESDQIINNLLFYSRIKTPQYEDIPLNPVIEECVHLCRSQFGTKKRLSIRQRIGPTEQMVIQADQLQLKELLSNILNNSCDALPPDGGWIEVCTENNSIQVRIVIRDNGMGIDKQHVEKIFDPFFTTKAKGTGLGLAVCRQIVNLHGGEIKIESERGKGTAFHILLPVRRESAGA